MASILLVEDETELARLIVRELEAAGFGVVLAPDGEAALRCFDERTEHPPRSFVGFSEVTRRTGTVGQGLVWRWSRS